MNANSNHETYIFLIILNTFGASNRLLINASKIYIHSFRINHFIKLFLKIKSYVKELKKMSTHIWKPVDRCCRIHQLRLSRWVRLLPINAYSGYIKQSDGEALVMLDLWGGRGNPSLLSLPGPLWPGVIAPEILVNEVKWFQVLICITDNSIKYQSFIYTVKCQSSSISNNSV